MQKINIGLFGLLIIILLILYQNFKIIHYNNELQSSIDNLNLLVEDIHNDVHELWSTARIHGSHGSNAAKRRRSLSRRS